MNEKNCYRCGKPLFRGKKPILDFETDTVMTGIKSDKPQRRLICKICLSNLRAGVQIK